MSFIVKIANTEDEFKKISLLNYETFVEEIPQHQENEDKKLLDRFHDENEYIICKEGKELLGMIALRDKRPFSLDEKLGKIELYTDLVFKKPCEVRLLAVKKSFRNGRVFAALTGGLIRYCLQKGYDIAFISGTTRQTKLYRHLGFEPFAHLVGEDEAVFQPMYLTKQMFYSNKNLKEITNIHSFLPGPVTLEDGLLNSLNTQPIWHRSDEHKQTVYSVRKKLTQITNAKNAIVLTGSGTLGNDVVAAHLASIGGKGLILSNGEFGERLMDHATRFNLDFTRKSYSWGQAFNLEEIRNILKEGHYDWIWFVHCETSTGMLNDLTSIVEICEELNIKVCLDAISSIGAVKVNLGSVYIATGVSGKAIGAITGLTFVLFNTLKKGIHNVPRYLDIQYYENSEGIPFSQNSNLFQALDQALDNHVTPHFYEKRKVLFEQVMELVDDNKFNLVVSRDQSSPCVLTISFSKDIDSTKIGDDLFLNGYLVHYRNRYLIENNWIQIAFMDSQQDIKNIHNVIMTIKDLTLFNGELTSIKNR